MRNRITVILVLVLVFTLSLTANAQDDDVVPPPDGQIAFSRDGGDLGQSLVMINTDGTDEVVLADMDGNDVTPRWALNGQFLIFNSRGNGDVPYRVDADGENLEVAADVSGFSPNLGPDGKTLTFMTSSNVHIATLGTEEVLSVTNESFSYIPYWSPNGDLIVYAHQGTSSGTGQETIRVISPEGGEPDVLHTVTGDVEGLVWSRDGAYIAFGVDSGAEGAVYLLEVETGEVTQLTDSSAYFATQPSFSPDGLWVAFQYRELDSGNALCNQTSDAVYVIDINGENLQAVTSEGACYPDWRPEVRGE